MVALQKLIINLDYHKLSRLPFISREFLIMQYCFKLNISLNLSSTIRNLSKVCQNQFNLCILEKVLSRIERIFQKIVQQFKQKF